MNYSVTLITLLFFISIFFFFVLVYIFGTKLRISDENRKFGWEISEFKIRNSWREDASVETVICNHMNTNKNQDEYVDNAVKLQRFISQPWLPRRDFFLPFHSLLYSENVHEKSFSSVQATHTSYCTFDYHSRMLSGPTIHSMFCFLPRVIVFHWIRCNDQRRITLLQRFS